jgi:rare lipoprotein A
MKNIFIVFSFFLVMFFVSCATISGPPKKKTLSGGATYNADEPGLRAAHAELEFDTRVRVTNLNNNRAVIVTITDRIPNEPERIIHISKMAGDNIEMSHINATPVLIEILGRPKFPRYTTLPAAN